MSLQSNTLTSTNLATEFNTTTCNQYAEADIHFYRLFYHVGAVLPILVWPLLPSTSAVVNYRILLGSTSLLLGPVYLWTIVFWKEITLRTVWLAPLLFNYCVLGYIGIKADWQKRRILREDFRTIAETTLALLCFALSQSLDSLVRPLVVGGKSIVSDYSFTFALISTHVVGILVIYILIYRSLIEWATTCYYHVTTRQIPAFYWLPQNGAQTDFNPWWSRQLRFAVCYYTMFLVFILLARSNIGTNVGSECLITNNG